ncbi:MAG TPA: hypothetical protein VLB44_20285 [Kofleriaceae bacterium]|nr:hypothetical protein [Kofleriaceae bacterium]
MLALVAACDRGARSSPRPPVDCKAVVALIAGKITRPSPSAPDFKAKYVPVFEASCVEDRWPEAYKTCVIDSRDASAMEACDRLAPGIGKKLAERIDRTAPLEVPILCADLVPKIRAAFVAYDAHSGLVADHLMPTLLAACIDDRWPENLKACIQKAEPDALVHGHACDALVPNALAVKLAARLQPMLPPGTEIDLPH